MKHWQVWLVYLASAALFGLMAYLFGSYASAQIHAHPELWRAV